MGLTEELMMIRDRVMPPTQPAVGGVVRRAVPGDMGLKELLAVRAQYEADAEQACRAAIDPKAVAALEQARAAHTEAATALEKARKALEKHGDKPSGWKLGGNGTWYEKRDTLARAVDHLALDTDEAAAQLAEQEKTYDALMLAAAQERMPLIMEQEQAAQAAYLRDKAALDARLNASREVVQASGRVLDKLTRQARKTGGT